MAGVLLAQALVLPIPAVASSSEPPNTGDAAHMGQSIQPVRPAVLSGGQASAMDAGTSGTTPNPDGIRGIDVSGFQGNVDWAVQKGAGIQFAYVSISEGNYALNSFRDSQTKGSTAAGL